MARGSPRGPGGRRSGWSRLSTDYRARLRRSGITREAWQRGADLRAARGHPPANPEAAPRAVTERYLEGEATTIDRETIRRWRETEAPDWIPPPIAVGDDVAAALSQLRPPSEWSRVDFTPRGGGEPWSMTVTYDRGYPETIEIPGGVNAKEVMGFIDDWNDGYYNDYEDDIDYDVGESE